MLPEELGCPDQRPLTRQRALGVQWSHIALEAPSQVYEIIPLCNLQILTFQSSES